MKVAEFQIQRNVYPVKPTEVSGINRNSSAVSMGKSSLTESSFSDILEKKIGEKRDLKFSAHAIRRLDERNIRLSQTDLSRLENGMKQVKDKGAKCSLILVDDMTYIVSVPNKTVITALKKEATLGNVFTNIDSVAIV